MIIRINKTKVCTGVKGMCSTSTGEINFDVHYLNERTNKTEIMKDVKFKILDTPCQLILPDIIKHKLLTKLVRHFQIEESGQTPTHPVDGTSHDDPGVRGQPSASDVHPHYLNLLIRKDEVLDPEPDDDGIVLKVEEYPWEKEENDLNAENKPDPVPRVEGSAGLQKKLHELVRTSARRQAASSETNARRSTRGL